MNPRHLAAIILLGVIPVSTAWAVDPAPDAPAKEQKICRTSASTGSRVEKKICRTKEQWGVHDRIKANDSRRIADWVQTDTDGE